MRAAFQMPRAAPTGNLVTGIREALHWLWHQPLLRALALLSAAGDFLFSGIGLIPMVIAQQQMHASPVAIGLIFTFAAIGGIVGSFFSSWVQRRLTLGQAVIGSEWATSLLFPLPLVAPNPLGLGLVRTLLSTTVSVSNPIRLNYQLAVTPDRLQGRVNSLTALIAYGSLPLGRTLTGIMLQVAGSTSTVLAITVLLLVEAVAAILSRHIRQATWHDRPDPA
jgi:MFS family permease